MQSINYSYKILNSAYAYLQKTSHGQISHWISDNYLKGANDRYRIWYIAKGSGSVKTTLGEFPIEENHLYFFPIDSILSAFYRDSMEQLYVDFLPSLELNFFSNYYLKPYRSDNVLLAKPLMEYIFKHYREKDESSVVFCNAALTTLLSCFFDTSKEKQKNNIMLNVIEYLDAHFCDEDISIQTLAETFHFSNQHFERLFKKYYNITPKSYIINKRINKAQTLLKTTNKSVRDIALECGFPDQFHFSRLFKNVISLSPIQFRKYKN